MIALCYLNRFPVLQIEDDSHSKIKKAHERLKKFHSLAHDENKIALVVVQERICNKNKRFDHPASGIETDPL